MIPLRLTEAAERAAQRYDQLAQTFSAIYSAALMSGEFGYAGQAQKMFADLYQAAHAYFEREEQEIASALEGIAREAHQSAIASLRSIDAENLSDAALAHLRESQTYLADELSAQLHRDIANLRLSLQRAVLEASIISRSRRIPSRQAQMALVMKGHETPELTFVDRIGRRTPTRTFVRSIWRQTLLSVHNETVLHAIAGNGVKHASVMKLEDGTLVHLDRLAIEDYAAIRDSLFHPNSNAYLDVEIANV